ncbi:MAG: GGDEF domain-containing protein [Cytophagaceae bacterium]|nr:MAG: GGDEF domain-containing protein [Cytophagaceae bacterium]
MHVAVRHFAGLASSYKKCAGALLLVAAALIWQTVISDNYRGRIELVTLINMTLFAASAVVILRMEKPGFPERFTAGIFIITALVSLARFVVAVSGHGTSDYRNDNSLVQHVYLATFAISLISLSLGFMLMVMRRVQEQLEYAASHDDLTGTYTRATFFAFLERELDRSRRHRYPLSVLIMDIDDFKRINDCHGHPVGDEVIKHFARLTADELRSHDVFCRYGGEEFVALLPSTGLDEANVVAERIRQRFGDFVLQGLPSSTVSIGVASTCSGQSTQAQLIESADQALYIAKHLGKNRVELAPGTVMGSQPVHSEKSL